MCTVDSGTGEVYTKEASHNHIIGTNVKGHSKLGKKARQQYTSAIVLPVELEPASQMAGKLQEPQGQAVH